MAYNFLHYHRKNIIGYNSVIRGEESKKGYQASNESIRILVLYFLLAMNQLLILVLHKDMEHFQNAWTNGTS